MDAQDMELIIGEIMNFDTLKDEYNYTDVVDLIAHYIEEGIIGSEQEFMEVARALKTEFEIAIGPDLWWGGVEAP